MQRIPEFRRLHARGLQARGLVVDRDGVALGPDGVLVQRSSPGYRSAAPEMLHKLVYEVFDDDRRLHALPQRLTAINRALRPAIWRKPSSSPAPYPCMIWTTGSSAAWPAAIS